MPSMHGLRACARQKAGGELTMMGMLTIYIAPSTITNCSLTKALAKQRPRRWNATHIVRTPKRHLFLFQNIYISDKGVRVPESNTKPQASTQTRMTSLAAPPSTPCSQTSATRSAQRQAQGHFESTSPYLQILATTRADESIQRAWRPIPLTLSCWTWWPTTSMN